MPSRGFHKSPQDLGYYTYILKDPKDMPFVVFKFHCFSWGRLAKLNVIPKNHNRLLLNLSQCELCLKRNSTEVVEVNETIGMQQRFGSSEQLADDFDLKEQLADLADAPPLPNISVSRFFPRNFLGPQCTRYECARQDSDRSSSHVGYYCKENGAFSMHTNTVAICPDEYKHVPISEATLPNQEQELPSRTALIPRLNNAASLTNIPTCPVSYFRPQEEVFCHICPLSNPLGDLPSTPESYRFVTGHSRNSSSISQSVSITTSLESSNSRDTLGFPATVGIAKVVHVKSPKLLDFTTSDETTQVGTILPTKSDWAANQDLEPLKLMSTSTTTSSPHYSHGGRKLPISGNSDILGRYEDPFYTGSPVCNLTAYRYNGGLNQWEIDLDANTNVSPKPPKRIYFCSNSDGDCGACEDCSEDFKMQECRGPKLLQPSTYLVSGHEVQIKYKTETEISTYQHRKSVASISGESNAEHVVLLERQPQHGNNNSTNLVLGGLSANDDKSIVVGYGSKLRSTSPDVQSTIFENVRHDSSDEECELRQTNKALDSPPSKTLSEGERFRSTPSPHKFGYANGAMRRIKSPVHSVGRTLKRRAKTFLRQSFPPDRPRSPHSDPFDDCEGKMKALGFI
jgi:hypothetical protein